MKNLCVFCNKNLKDGSRVPQIIKCLNCDCGILREYFSQGKGRQGITRQQYLVMKKNGEGFDFTCKNCQPPSLNILSTNLLNVGLQAKLPPSSLDIPEVGKPRFTVIQHEGFSYTVPSN